MTDFSSWVRGVAGKYIPPNALLHGSYAYVYSGFQHASPAFQSSPGKQPIPQIGGFVELTPSSANPPAPGTYQQVEGYVPIAFTGYIAFHGNSQLNGTGMVSIGQNNHQVGFEGNYDVKYDATANVHWGTLATIDANSKVQIDHYFVVADDWKELRFIITHTGKRQFVANGSMRRVTSF